MSGLTHVNYLGDKRHTVPVTDGILYYSKMDARQAQEQIQQHEQQRQQKKSARSSRWRRESHADADNASIFSQSSTVSLIKSKLHRSRNPDKAREDEMKRTMRAQ